MATRAIDRGPVAEQVAQNLKRLRAARGLSLTGLSARLDRLGRPIQATGLHKIEQGDRRVDADDLVALAVALSVNPLRLLLPGRADDTEVQLTPTVSVPASVAWEWGSGNAPLPRDAGDDDEELEDWRVINMPPERRRTAAHPAMRALDRIRRAIAREIDFPPPAPDPQVHGRFKVLMARLDAEIEELFPEGERG